MKHRKAQTQRISGIARCLLLSLLTAILAFSYFVIKGHGALTILDDYDKQVLTFATTVWDMVHSSDPGEWVWNIDLGSSFVTAFSYYNLGDPFFWLYLLLPRGSFPYYAWMIYIAKYTLAGVTAYIYLSHMIGSHDVHDENCAIVGALIYAFSGYQAANLLFFIFHNAVAFFPLLLYGIETIDDKKKRPLFILAIWISCLSNYFFFVMEVIFMLIYFVFRNKDEKLMDVAGKFKACIVCGIIGVGMAAVLFIPNIIFVLRSSRSSGMMTPDAFYDLASILYIFKGMLLPGDTMSDECALAHHTWKSTFCYLPLFGMSFVIAYIKKEKTWLKWMLATLLVISLSPILQAGFLLFTQEYQRWWFMLTLMTALATVKVLKDPNEYPIAKGTAIYVSAIVVLALTLFNGNAVYHPRRFIFFLLVAISGPSILTLMCKTNRMKDCLVIVMTVVMCAGTTALVLHYYRVGTSTDKYMAKYESSLQLKTLDDQYRYATTDNIRTVVGNVSGIGTFSSTIENSSAKLTELVTGYYFWDGSSEREYFPELITFLGGKYVITNDKDADNIVYEFTEGEEKLYVTEQDAFPIGYVKDAWISEEEFLETDIEDRVKILEQAAVVSIDDADKIGSTMQQITADDIDINANESDLIVKAESDKVSDFKTSSHGFSCKTDYDKQAAVYFTIPNDPGWTVHIDGEETEIIDSIGMMIVVVPEGLHEITVVYNTPGLRTGIVVSVVSWGIFYVYIAIQHYKNRRQAMAVK